MKISEFYSDEASEQWFNTRYGEPTIHESLIERGYKILDRQSLKHTHAEQVIPTNQIQLSWGGSIPTPPAIFKNTFLAKELYELRGLTYRSETVSDLISRWMQSLPANEKYLVSLNPKNYLVATAEQIHYDDIFTVSRTWNIDSWIGVFDKECTSVFIFDLEFDVVIVSFSPSSTPEGYAQFSQTFNNEFNEIFVRDAKLRTGADPLRAQEYMDKIQHLIG